MGIGTDFNHGAGIVGFNNEAESVNVTKELVRRGYSEADIDKMLATDQVRQVGALDCNVWAGAGTSCGCSVKLRRRRAARAVEHYGSVRLPSAGPGIDRNAAA